MTEFEKTAALLDAFIVSGFFQGYTPEEVASNTLTMLELQTKGNLEQINVLMDHFAKTVAELKEKPWVVAISNG